jgi:thiamine pyrophosphate-dependent acetolactate synthase large subunit-like protein
MTAIAEPSMLFTSTDTARPEALGKTSKNREDPAALSRREFLGTTAGAGAATLLGTNREAAAQDADLTNAGNKLAAPSPQTLERDTGGRRPPASARAVQRAGSDLMVQVLHDLDIEYVAANPAASFEGLQESIINYRSANRNPNEMPELISALHEESAVDMATGYARAEGRPIAVMLHGTVGTMHAAMAIYQAFHSQTPIVMIAGRSDTEFLRQQTANDIAGIVRAFTKWDAQPTTLDESLTALQEAYRQAITPPRGPVLVVMDIELQKQEAGDLAPPSYTPPVMPAISAAQAAEVARSLVAAENPRISVGRLRTPRGVELAIELAELTGATVRSRASSVPMSFPERHPLCGPGSDPKYDFVLGLETSGADAAIIGPHIRTVDDRDATGIGFGMIRKPVAPIRGPGAPPKPGSNDMSADAEASLPLIIGEVERLLPASGSNAISERSKTNAQANHEARIAALEKALEERRLGWNGSPVSLARLFAELWVHIRDEDWCLASPTVFSSRHNVALWDHNKPYSYLGMHGGGGIGYCIGASTGAALAAKHRNRIVINIQCDGDLNYTPGALWTAAHHRLPMLVVMHNNRAWHQELMYMEHIAGVRGRGMNRMHIGTTLRDPDISYAKMAEAYGIEGEGPIDDPGLLSAAFRRGVDTVKQGRPYLIDVLTQPR